MSKGFIGGDDRVKQTNQTESRADRGTADHSRKLQDGTAFSIEERRRMLRNEYKQEILPTPPSIPGYHLCWLSTNSRADPIHNRIHQGYEAVKNSELPGMDKWTMKDGEFSGFVSCNEMVLFKIPEELYQLHMSIFHHEMPLEHEQGVRADIEAHNLESAGVCATEVDGFKDMGAHRATPYFN